MKKLLFFILTVSFVLPFSYCRAADMIITSFSPSSGKVGDTITIIGENYSGANSVIFKSSSGTVSSSISSITGTTLTTTVPSGAISGKISIETINSGVSKLIESPSSFTVLGKDITFSFTPDTGKVGDDIVLSTNDSFSGVNYVSFGGVKATPKLSNPNFIEVDVPSGAKTGKIVIETDGGSIESKTDFTVNTTSSATTTSTTSTTTTSTTSTSNSSSSDYVNPKISFNEGSLVPVCNKGAINSTTGKYANDCDFEDLMALVNKLINYVLIRLATPLFTIIIIYVGAIYLTAGGNPNKVSSAKKIMQNAIWGYVIALLAWLIIKTILTTFGFVDVNKWF